jgi:hypothetical protein
MEERSSKPRSARKPVFLSAQLVAGAARLAVRLRNLSEQGALVEGTNLPVAGTVTTFERGDLQVVVTVAWADGGLAGISFGRTLAPSEVLRHIAVPAPRPQGDYRRPGFRTRPLTPEERRLLDMEMTTSSRARD